MSTATAVQSAARRRMKLIGDRRGVSLLPVGIFLCCLLWRAPWLLTAPRFWGEEASVYYQGMQGLGFLEGISQVFRGNYQLVTNAAVEAALMVPPRYSAHVTTYIGLAAALGCCWMLSRLLLNRGCSVWTASAACAMFALQPGGYEVFLSATNLQWVSSVVALLLCVSEDVPAVSARALGRYALLVLCGLNGTTSCILLPLFLIGAVIRRSGLGWGMAVVMVIVTAIQAGIVMAHHDDIVRVFSMTSHLLLPEVFQVFFAHLMPAQLLDLVGTQVLPRDSLGRVTAIEVVLLGFAGMTAVAFMARRRLGWFTVGMLMAGAVVPPLVNEYGSIAGADAMLSGWAGARYFFIGATCMLILMAASLEASTLPERVAGGFIVGLVLLNGVGTAEVATWTSQYLNGPSVAEQVDGCGEGPSCSVSAWPMIGSFPLIIQRRPLDVQSRNAIILH